MNEILQEKGGLLDGSFSWILEHPDFRHWRGDNDKRVLWITGDPGKGKTMLLCGIIDSLTTTTESTPLSFFFCRGTDSRISNATSVLRGIIYQLLKERPSLIPPIRKKYQTTNSDILKDLTAWVSLEEILTDILQDKSLANTQIIIDALDECRTDLQKLLNFLVQKFSSLPHIRWIVSSRHRYEIEERLKLSGQIVELSLESNSGYVSDAVKRYINHKVGQLTQMKGYNPATEAAVRDHLFRNAYDTYLWVSLVCQALELTSRLQATAKLTKFPPKLEDLYQTMMEQVLKSDDAALCKSVLALLATAYGPISLRELGSLTTELEDKLEDLSYLIELCGSFLVIRGSLVSFVHQSAKDFLLSPAASKQIFDSGMEAIHHQIFSKSRMLLDERLQYNMYDIPQPGTLISEVTPPLDDILALIHYSCIYWMDHACDMINQTTRAYVSELTDAGFVFEFLTSHFLHWLESLSLLRSLPEGVLSIRRLFETVQESPSYVSELACQTNIFNSQSTPKVQT